MWGLGLASQTFPTEDGEMGDPGDPSRSPQSRGSENSKLAPRPPPSSLLCSPWSFPTLASDLSPTSGCRQLVLTFLFCSQSLVPSPLLYAYRKRDTGPTCLPSHPRPSRSPSPIGGETHPRVGGVFRGPVLGGLRVRAVDWLNPIRYSFISSSQSLLLSPPCPAVQALVAPGTMLRGLKEGRQPSPCWQTKALLLWPMQQGGGGLAEERASLGRSTHTPSRTQTVPQSCPGKA